MYASALSSSKTRKLAILSAMATIAFVVMAVGRVPVIMFLKYDPKDVVITFAGLIYGPMSAFVISLVVSFVEMITVSDTFIIGFIMNVLSTCAFSCTAAYIYKKLKTLRGAVTGLIAGILLATAVMLLWNYLITPMYMGYPRQAVADMLVPVFLPFNLLKGGINATLTLLLYKPLIRALRGSGMLPAREEGEMAVASRKAGLGVMLVAGVVLVTCILVVMVLQGIL